MTLLQALVLSLLLLGAPVDCWAHAFLAGATPPAGAVVPAAPTLTLRFSEAVEPAFCVIEVSDPGGAKLRLPPPRAVGGDARRLSVAMPPLPDGNYTVIWRVTSADTHRTEGRYQFTVGH